MYILIQAPEFPECLLFNLAMRMSQSYAMRVAAEQAYNATAGKSKQCKGDRAKWCSKPLAPSSRPPTFCDRRRRGRSVDEEVRAFFANKKSEDVRAFLKKPQLIRRFFAKQS